LVPYTTLFRSVIRGGSDDVVECEGQWQEVIGGAGGEQVLRDGSARSQASGEPAERGICERITAARSQVGEACGELGGEARLQNGRPVERLRVEAEQVAGDGSVDDVAAQHAGPGGRPAAAPGGMGLESQQRLGDG